jgi:hypothetical protein
MLYMVLFDSHITQSIFEQNNAALMFFNRVAFVFVFVSAGIVANFVF